MVRDRWLTFDCFGTLIDWVSGFRAILAPLAGERTDALMETYNRIERDLEADKPHRLYRDVLTTGLAQAARSLGLSLPDAHILVSKWGDQPLFPDVPEALQTVRESGWKIAILTNCDDDLFTRTVERNQQLAPDLAITAEQVRSYKPAFGHFTRFEQRTGVARQDWVHVANSWFHDIAPARHYGITSIWVNRDRSSDDPAMASRVIANMTGLGAIVGVLCH